MSREDELREELTAVAKLIASRQSDPRTWLSWVVYMLARLEEQTTQGNPMDRSSFLDMLTALQDEIRNRRRTGGWM
ncbi:MAG: hypothetical protein R6W69_06930 [Anaerolineales bacterium]|jgi:hypothetical protein